MSETAFLANGYIIKIIGIIIAGIFAIFSILIAIFGLIFHRISKLMDDDPKSRTIYIDKLKQRKLKFRKIYKNSLQKVLDKLDTWMGEPFSAKALNINTGLAVFYAIFLFIISWAGGGSGNIGTIPVLPESFSILQRFGFLLVLISSMFALLYHKKIDSWAKTFIRKKLVRKKSKKAVTFRISPVLILTLGLTISVLFVSKHITVLFVAAAVVAFMFIGILYGVTFITVTRAFAVSFAIAVTAVVRSVVASSFPTIGTVISFGLYAVPLIASHFLYKKMRKRIYSLLYGYSIFLLIFLFVGLSFYLKFLKVNDKLFSYLFFMILLPFINGFLDYISLGISRCLGRKILKKNRIWCILLHLGIDIVAAIVLLGCLVLILSAGIEAFNIYVVKDKQIMINLAELIQTARNNPLGADGFWITIMLFSTLFPTFVHFMVAFAGIYTNNFTTEKLQKDIIARLKQESPAKHTLTKPAIYFTLRNMFNWGIVPLSVAGFCGLFAFGFSRLIIPFSDLLYEIAVLGLQVGRGGF
jgi:hypothetical protein